MTEEKGCKNCDALGVDSEIGVYYCCLSHRQDDLPKEFICDDYTPNKQLKRLEQENKDLKKQIESQKGLITVGSKQQYEMTKAYDKCKIALEEINRTLLGVRGLSINCNKQIIKVKAIINEVLND